MTFRSLLVPASLLLVSAQAKAADAMTESDTQAPAPIEFRVVPHYLNPVAESDSVLNAALHDDLWERIRAGFQMPPLEASLVKDHENWVVNRPDYLKRVTGRARRYMYHIVEALEKRGMPTELALLPIVESAYNPTAYSPAHASGLWQFIPSTGKTYGLEQTWWYDGRRDVVAATEAAINYFEYLYSLFGDWNLVLASYNWGEGAVGRAVQKNRDKGLPTDFMSLNMPAETRNYVPKLMALRNIVSNPAAYGVKLDPIPNRPYFVTVAPNRHIDTKLAAQLADMSVQDFTELNPAYTKPVIASKDSRRILVPVDKADSFLSKLANYDKPTLSWQAYGTRKGESLSDIASSHGIDLDELRKFNKLPAKAKVATGQILLVPMSDDDNNSLSIAAGAPTLASPVPLRTTRKNLLPSLAQNALIQTPAVQAKQEERLDASTSAMNQPQKPAPIIAMKPEATVPVKTAPVLAANPVKSDAMVKPANVVEKKTPETLLPVKPMVSEPAKVTLASTETTPLANTAVVTVSTTPKAAPNQVTPAESATVVLASTTPSPANSGSTEPNAGTTTAAAENTKLAMLQLDQKDLSIQKAKLQDKPLTPATYTVVKGDTLYNIAKRFNLSTDELGKLNRLDGHGIRLGQVLKVGGGNTLANTTQLATAKEKADNTKLAAVKQKQSADQEKRQAKEREREKSTLYTVRQGDTLYSIARKYKVTPVELKKWNDIPKTLQPGDKVKVLITQG